MVEIFTVGGGEYIVNVLNAVAAWTGAGGYKSLIQVALVMGISQGGFAFAPLAFGALRVTGTGGQAPLVFAAAAVLQIGAVIALLLGMPRQSPAPIVNPL